MKAKVYQLTKKAPSFSWHKVTIKRLIYEAMQELKRADIPKIVDAVIARGEVHHTKLTPTAELEHQIRSYLCHFANEGVVKRMEDRRHRPSRRLSEAADIKSHTG